MLDVSDISALHIELTDKCQAQCPMCSRNWHGGELRPFIKGIEVSLATFKEWFPIEFLGNLDKFYSCGNYGDPVFARDCLEIFEYVADVNPSIKLSIHTNGGMRNIEWWKKIAKIFNKNGREIFFAIDGFKGKHELYRKNTNYDKILENLTAFIDAGGRAKVDSLVFKHNQDDVEELQKYLLSLGVLDVKFISTTRFYDQDKFEVLDKDNSVQYYLEPASNTKFKKNTRIDIEKLSNRDFFRTAVTESNIIPKCSADKEIYVDPKGDIFPCCWFGAQYTEVSVPENNLLYKMRNETVSDAKKVLNEIGVPNCSSKILYSNTTLWPSLPNYWEGDNKCLTCVVQCSDTLIDKKDKYV